MLPCKNCCEIKRLAYFLGMHMVKGENTDLFIKGHQVHIQTEDWGADESVFVCRVFKDGSVLKTFKIPYSQFGSFSSGSEKKEALAKLHQRVIDWSYQEI